MASVLAALQAVRAGLSINDLMTRVNVSKGRIDKALQLMSLETPAPIVKQGGKWTLTAALNLPFHPVLERTDDRPPQKQMANSSQQARNVDGSLRIHGTVPTGPVLLVDDMVDSRWTLTVAAYLLITHGSGPVHPMALASTAHADE